MAIRLKIIGYGSISMLLYEISNVHYGSVQCLIITHLLCEAVQRLAGTGKLSELLEM